MKRILTIVLAAVAFLAAENTADAQLLKNLLNKVTGNTTQTTTTTATTATEATVNGKAAGFNIALLTEIANRAQVNIELVQIETGARAMALSSNKVDAVFWTKSLTCSECNETFVEEIKGALVTESYFSETNVGVALKSDK